MRPPIAYYGSKGRLGPWIASLLPPHRTYLESHSGSAAVLFAKPPSPTEIINDLDGQVVNFFRVLRDQPAELERACRLTPYTRAEFEACADLDAPGLDEVERARRFFTRINQSFGKTTRPRHGWAVTANTGGADHAHKFTAMVGRLHACTERLRRVQIECRPALEVITRHATPDTAIYCDPPYLATVRSVRTKRPGLDYGLEHSTETDHRELAAALHATPAAVLISGYPSPLYEELYAGWWRAERAVTRPSANQPGRSGESGLEVIWSNRPIREQLILGHPEPEAVPR